MIGEHNQAMFEESVAEAWQKRYGVTAPSGIPEIGGFLTHRSVRRYTHQPVSREIAEGLIAAAQSAATSSNLQLWTAISVQEPDKRAELAHLCADQKQILDAAWFFCFIADLHRLEQAAREAGQEPDALDYNEFYTMAVVDAALAAERMVCAAESLGLGICYIGALRNDPEGVKRALHLPSRTFGVFGLCIGWPAEDSPGEIKPRLAPSAVWHEEAYNHDPGIEEYQERMKRFYDEQGMKGSVSWAMRSGRRARVESLTGRHVLKEFLAGQGLDVR